MDIVITVGPSSWSEPELEALFDLGVKFVRFPLGKEDPDVHAKVFHRICQIEARKGSGVTIVGDLPGGKPRFANRSPVQICSNRSYSIGLHGSVDAGLDFFLDPGVNVSGLSVGGFAAVGDGENAFLVEELVGEIVRGRFLRPGVLERRRAFIPTDREISFTSFTEADREILVKRQGIRFDWLALSFVDSAQDIEEARFWLRKKFDWTGKIVAKIESRKGVANAEEIAGAADAVMVARGDLALQVGFAELWNSQRDILNKAIGLDKYCIVGTGFLESFANTAVPSRSEVMDVSATLSMGANAIMLSGETTIGRFPIEAVRFLREIAARWVEGLTSVGLA